MIGVAAVKNRGLQMFARFQLVTKIERIEGAGHAHGVNLASLYRNSPGSRPRQCAKPDFAMLFVGDSGPGRVLAAVAGNGKPRIRLVAGRSPAAFNDAGSALNRFLIQRPLAGPAAGQIAQGVTGGGQGPLRGGGLFNHDRLFFPIFNTRGPRQNAALGVHGVAQGYVNFAGNILEQYVYGMGIVRRGLNKMKYQIAIAIGKTDLERGFGEQARTPAGILLRRGSGGRVERSPLRKGMRGSNGVVRVYTSTPVDRLYLAALVDPEGISGIAAIEAEDLGGL